MASMNDILTYIERAGIVAKPLQYIIEDPALPDLSLQIIRLHALEQSKNSDVGTANEKPGIGMKYLIPPLKVYTALRATRLPPYLVLGLIAGGFVFVGYLLGKK